MLFRCDWNPFLLIYISLFVHQSACWPLFTTVWLHDGVLLGQFFDIILGTQVHVNTNSTPWVTINTNSTPWVTNQQATTLVRSRIVLKYQPSFLHTFLRFSDGLSKHQMALYSCLLLSHPICTRQYSGSHVVRVIYTYIQRLLRISVAKRHMAL